MKTLILLSFLLVSYCGLKGQSLGTTLISSAVSSAGAAQSTLDNTTPNLVNDLDISVGRIMPFVLNPNSPAANATTGDNDVDNVEQIIFSLSAPIEILEVDNEGALTGGSQDYSLIISGNTNFEGVCEVVSNQGNNSIDDGRYCNITLINTEAIINNKTTKHRSMDRIVLKPGFRCINGASSKFEVVSGYAY